MKCGKCGKEFQTYNGICPFCHSKNEKDAQEQPSIKYVPIVKPNPISTVRPRNPTENTSPYIPVKPGKTPDNTLKYILTGSIVLLVVILAAATVQSFIGGSSSPSNPDIYTAPTATDEPVPSLAPIISTTQPKITYSGSKAGTLSPYSSDSDPVPANPVAPDYVAPGHRSTPGIPSTEFTSTGANSGLIVVYITPNPTVPSTSQNQIAPITIRSTPTPIPSVPTTVKKTTGATTTVPTSTVTVTPTYTYPPQEYQKGMVLSGMDKGVYKPYYYLVIDVSFQMNIFEGYTDGQWMYTLQRLYRHPNRNTWYLAEWDYSDTGDAISVQGMEYGRYPTGEILDVNSVPAEPYVEPTPRWREGDIVNVREKDGSWNKYYIYSYSNEDRYDAYTAQIIVPKEDGSWGYLDGAYYWHHEPAVERYYLDTSANTLFTHIESSEGFEYIEAPLPIFTQKPPTPTPT